MYLDADGEVIEKSDLVEFAPLAGVLARWQVCGKHIQKFGSKPWAIWSPRQSSTPSRASSSSKGRIVETIEWF
jgi:hypothetical protein